MHCLIFTHVVGKYRGIAVVSKDKHAVASKISETNLRITLDANLLVWQVDDEFMQTSSTFFGGDEDCGDGVIREFTAMK